MFSLFVQWTSPLRLWAIDGCTHFWIDTFKPHSINTDRWYLRWVLNVCLEVLLSASALESCHRIARLLLELDSFYLGAWLALRHLFAFFVFLLVFFFLHLLHHFDFLVEVAHDLGDKLPPLWLDVLFDSHSIVVFGLLDFESFNRPRNRLSIIS